MSQTPKENTVHNGTTTVYCTEKIDCTHNAVDEEDIFKLHEGNVFFDGVMTGVKIVCLGLSVQKHHPRL